MSAASRWRPPHLATLAPTSSWHEDNTALFNTYFADSTFRDLFMRFLSSAYEEIRDEEAGQL